jgi:anti-sigma factor RsiW
MTCAEIQELSPQYLSGELNAQRTFEFAAHLASCADCDLDQRLRASVLSEEVDTSRLEQALRNRIRANRRHVPGWAVAAAAGIALAIAGGLAYRAFFGPQTPPLCVAAAQDHRREIVNGEPKRWLTDLSAIQTIAEKQGVPASAITALATTGYRLERGRLCSLKKQIFLHLVYTKDGGEFSVYLRSRGSEASVGPEGLAYFQTDRLTAMFVDEQSRAQAAAFARAGLHSLMVVAL